ncbi:RNA polymerase factor sigma-54 [Candidatus Palauibacter soopunensis]|uniref:RNA polymerase factor sigma-54 n=1 Tax=Candidatus Palauibacter soopunensis TaxID=3056739 RepID=UPI002388A6D7|nr:RNA polymerase factor sigma-54 [Candidatus Palauibacter soopunensis]MDE2880130.1 RNA polymerase factor sigma-54 [Candidatus Palauibacter soopunensis]
MAPGRPSLAAGLHLRQEQKAQPRLYQAMDLLHMPLLDLQGHLQQALVDNPFLDLVEPGDEPDDAGDDRDALAEDAGDDRVEEADEVDWEDVLLDDFDAGGRHEEYGDREFYTPAAAATPTLWDHLHEQLNLLRLGARQLRIGEEIIGNVDRDGFLSCSLDRIVEALDEVSREEVEGMLARIQSFEPSGIAARDLRETLLLQLRDRGRERSLAYRIVDGHFDDLANRRWPELAEEYGITPREVQTAADEIAKLDPKPGLRFADTSDSYVIPDLTVEKVQGRYRVSHADTSLPRLKLSPVYRDVAADRARFQGENKAFISERLNSARWLIQAIEQRRQTMLKVMDFIVERQHDFFEKGVEHLRPLTLRDVAKHIEMHESTVSRVTNGKYVQTPRGLYPLKFFFSGGYSTLEGEDLSSEGVRARIRKLVTEEDPTAPLSDHEITARLQKAGVRIARRTVAKYRDQLGILSARLRRRV